MFVYFIFEIKRQYLARTEEKHIIYVTLDRNEAVEIYKEKCMMFCLENYTTRDEFVIPFVIYETEFGMVDLDTANEICLETMILLKKHEYSLEDFKVSDETVPANHEFLAVLNERIAKINMSQKKKVTFEMTEKEKENERRFKADKRAYIMMKQDGCEIPHAVFSGWSLEQLQCMTLDDYNEHKNGNLQNKTTEYANLFM